MCPSEEQEKHQNYRLGKLCRSTEEARLKDSYSWAAAKSEKSPVKEDISIHFLLITFVFLLFFCSHYMSVPFLNSSMLSLRQMVWSHVVAWNPQRIAGTCRKGSYDAVLSQLMQLQVIEGLPGTNDGDIWNTEGGNRCSNSDLRLMNQKMCGEWTHLFLNPPFLGYHHQSCRETKLSDIIIGVWTCTTEKSHPPLDSLLRRLALELTCLPLLELGWSFTWGGWASADAGGWFDLSFGLEVHFTCGFF